MNEIFVILVMKVSFMKKQFFLPLLLLTSFAIGCSNKNSEPNYLIFDELPTTKEIPDNVSIEANGILPMLFAYYGTINGYDVFSWDDDNSFGFSILKYRIDQFAFLTQNVYVFYCVEHSETQKDFFVYDEQGTHTQLAINTETVTPFIKLYNDGAFDAHDVGYIYYARGSYLKENNNLVLLPDGYEMIYEYLEDGKVKIQNPTITRPNDYKPIE